MLCVCGVGVVVGTGDGVGKLVFHEEFAASLEYTFCPFTLTMTPFVEPFVLIDFFLCLNLE